jgi:hypothetical protein
MEDGSRFFAALAKDFLIDGESSFKKLPSLLE